MGNLDAKEWSKKFKFFCVANGLSQQDVVDKTGFPLYQIRNWQTGYSKPRKENQKVLAEKLGFDVEQFNDIENPEDVIEMKKTNLKWNHKLKAICMAKGLSLQDVADMVGVSRLCVSAWWRGTRRPPYKKQLILAEKLEIDISIFYEEDK